VDIGTKTYFYNWGNNKIDIYDKNTNTWTIAVLANIPIGNIFAANGTMYILVGDNYVTRPEDYSDQVYRVVL
jgi:hypothetical protein